MMPILNRVVLRLKTVSEPIASRLSLKFQQSIIAMAQMNLGEKSRVKVGHLGKEEGGSWRAKCILTMIGLYYVNDYREWHEREKELKARQEACREGNRDYEARKWARSEYEFPSLCYPGTTANDHPYLHSLYIKSIPRLRGKNSSVYANASFHCKAMRIKQGCSK